MGIVKFEFRNKNPFELTHLDCHETNQMAFDACLGRFVCNSRRRLAWVSREFRALHPDAAGWVDAAPSPWIIMADKDKFVESRHCLTWAGHRNQQNPTSQIHFHSKL